MASAEEIAGFDDPAITFREAGARAVEVRAEEVFALSEDVLDTGDIERVHDMRVATRRLRAVLEVFAPCFPAREHRRLIGEVKALADALGERRDPDVMIERLDEVAAAVSPTERSGLRYLSGELRREQESANSTLEDALEHAETVGLRVRLLALAAVGRVA